MGTGRSAQHGNRKTQQENVAASHGHESATASMVARGAVVRPPWARQDNNQWAATSSVPHLKEV